MCKSDVKGSSSPFTLDEFGVLLRSTPLFERLRRDDMDMQHYARMKEDQLSTEIIGLDERIAEFTEPENPDSRCVASYLKQLLKSKRSKLATLRYRRDSAN